MIHLRDVHLSLGSRDLLVGVDWLVRPGEKVGLVGRNGSGKTTLLRLLLGELRPDSGAVERRGGLEVGYLPQQAVSGSSRTLWEEAASGMVRLGRLEERMEAARRAMERREPGAVERFDQAQEAFRLAGGWAAEEKVGEVLHGLGFASADWHRACDTFSGGWQMRIALARLLLSDADLLLLDEPTNHLDILARSWLARFLAGTNHAAVVVSHDRHLLDRSTTRTAEVRGGRLHEFSGPLSAWLAEREARLQQAESAWREQQREIQRLERFVDRFRAKATKASQARSRAKRLERMERVEAPVAEPAPRYTLPEPPASALDALELRGATAGWPGGEPVLRDLDLVVERGMRLAVVGANGCGKSTLVHALAGRLRLREGVRLVGDGVRLGVFTQDLAQDIPGDRTGLEHLAAVAPEVPLTRAWGLLGALGLSGELAERPLDGLSGGEKARVALAGLAARPHNVLLLDEPTNHLDAVTVDVLVRALSGWEGALVVATHDRYLVEQVATHVLRFGPGGPSLHAGLRPGDLEVEPVSREGGRDNGGGEAWAERKRRARERERAQRRIEAIGERIEALEERMDDLDRAMLEAAEDWERSGALAAERREAQAEVDALFAEWQELEVGPAGD